MEQALLTIDQVAELTGTSRSTIRRSWYDGLFPKPVRIGRRGVRWRLDDVKSFIKSQAPELPAKVVSNGH